MYYRSFLNIKLCIWIGILEYFCTVLRWLIANRGVVKQYMANSFEVKVCFYCFFNQRLFETLSKLRKNEYLLTHQ